MYYKTWRDQHYGDHELAIAMSTVLASSMTTRILSASKYFIQPFHTKRQTPLGTYAIQRHHR